MPRVERRGTCVRCDRLLFRFLKHAQCVSTRSLRIGWPREAWHRVQRDQTAKKRQMGLCAGENSSFELRGSLGVGCWASADFTAPESPKGRPKAEQSGTWRATKTRPKRLAISTGHFLGGEMASSTWNQCGPVNRPNCGEQRDQGPEGETYSPSGKDRAPLLFQLDDDRDLRWRGISAGTRVDSGQPPIACHLG